MQSAADPAHPAALRSPAGAAPSLISLQGLSVDFPNLSGSPKRALNAIDLEVAPSEVVGLVGESGAGKTTLAPAAGRLLA